MTSIRHNNATFFKPKLKYPTQPQNPAPKKLRWKLLCFSCYSPEFFIDHHTPKTSSHKLRRKQLKPTSKTPLEPKFLNTRSNVYNSFVPHSQLSNNSPPKNKSKSDKLHHEADSIPVIRPKNQILKNQIHPKNPPNSQNNPAHYNNIEISQNHYLAPQNHNKTQDKPNPNKNIKEPKKPKSTHLPNNNITEPPKNPIEFNQIEKKPTESIKNISFDEVSLKSERESIASNWDDDFEDNNFAPKEHILGLPNQNRSKNNKSLRVRSPVLNSSGSFRPEIKKNLPTQAKIITNNYTNKSRAMKTIEAESRVVRDIKAIENLHASFLELKKLKQTIINTLLLSKNETYNPSNGDNLAEILGLFGEKEPTINEEDLWESWRKIEAFMVFCGNKRISDSQDTLKTSPAGSTSICFVDKHQQELYVSKIWKSITKKSQGNFFKLARESDMLVGSENSIENDIKSQTLVESDFEKIEQILFKNKLASSILDFPKSKNLRNISKTTNSKNKALHAHDASFKQKEIEEALNFSQSTFKRESLTSLQSKTTTGKKVSSITMENIVTLDEIARKTIKKTRINLQNFMQSTFEY
ncbi:hypothetical protein BB558_004367 [Smittium angustum]|uniref:Uncharacterized protein n=1 Tax=Smittium angustum TaxID=133377 RepID=A0A2U1J3G3_SMIAN|nr:hypothetical protein BB558_004367 [Smittium angustum]